MHKALHPRDDVDRLYVSRKEGGRGLASIKDTVEASIQRLEDYIEKHERELITAIRNDTDNTVDERMTTTRKQKWEGKQLYGRFKNLVNNISHQKTWTWLRKGNLKRETESLQIAALDNAIRTNHIKARIDKTQHNSKCGLCGDRDETINHIIRSIRRDTTGSARWSTGKRAGNFNSTIPCDVTCWHSNYCENYHLTLVRKSLKGKKLYWHGIYTRGVQNISRLKLYLTRQKLTMNETNPTVEISK